MNSPLRCANIVPEHVSARGDFDEEAREDARLVIACLMLDSSKRKCATLRYHATRAETSTPLETIYGEITAKKTGLSDAASAKRQLVNRYLGRALFAPDPLVGQAAAAWVSRDLRAKV